jgi:glycosyltransferase involved in cell wall biosynthesis
MGRAVDRALRPLADQYIANSRDVADFITDAHGVAHERISVIHNGIDNSIFRPRPTRRVTGRTPRIGSVGRLIPDKGMDVLLAALPVILAQRDVELAVAGDGEERARLELDARGLPVVFAGELSSPREVASFLHTLDVFVTASRYEGLPNAVLEALACNIPVVATAVPGMAEATKGRARLVRPDDPNDLADAVLATLAAETEVDPVAAQPSFADVARLHLEAFEHAVEVRRRSSSWAGGWIVRGPGPAPGSRRTAKRELAATRSSTPLVKGASRGNP